MVVGPAVIRIGTVALRKPGHGGAIGPPPRGHCPVASVFSIHVGYGTAASVGSITRCTLDLRLAAGTGLGFAFEARSTVTFTFDLTIPFHGLAVTSLGARLALGTLDSPVVDLDLLRDLTAGPGRRLGLTLHLDRVAFSCHIPCAGDAFSTATRRGRLCGAAIVLTRLRGLDVAAPPRLTAMGAVGPRVAHRAPSSPLCGCLVSEKTHPHEQNEKSDESLHGFSSLMRPMRDAMLSGFNSRAPSGGVN